MRDSVPDAVGIAITTSRGSCSTPALEAATRPSRPAARRRKLGGSAVTAGRPVCSDSTTPSGPASLLPSASAGGLPPYHPFPPPGPLRDLELRLDIHLIAAITGPSRPDRRVAVVGRSMLRNLTRATLVTSRGRRSFASGRRIWTSCANRSLCACAAGSHGDRCSALTRMRLQHHPHRLERVDTVSILRAGPDARNECAFTRDHRLPGTDARLHEENPVHVPVPRARRSCARCCRWCARSRDADHGEEPHSAATRPAGSDRRPAASIVSAGTATGSAVQKASAWAWKIEAGVTFSRPRVATSSDVASATGAPCRALLLIVVDTLPTQVRQLPTDRARFGDSDELLPSCMPEAPRDHPRPAADDIREIKLLQDICTMVWAVVYDRTRPAR